MSAVRTRLASKEHLSGHAVLKPGRHAAYNNNKEYCAYDVRMPIKESIRYIAPPPERGECEAFACLQKAL
jgi:hypothetical protein